MSASSRDCELRLPPKGALAPGGPTDPVSYYYHPFVGFLYRGRLKQAVSLLSPPYESILELGYGSGVLFPTLACIGKQLFGLDIDSDPLEVGRGLNRLGIEATLARGDIWSANYPDNRFDLVVAISIFEHIGDLSSVLDEIFRILRPGGHLLVGMPRVDATMEKLFPLIGVRDIGAHHVTSYHRFLKLSKQRFELVRFAHMPSFLPPAVGLYYNMLMHRT